MPAPSTFADRKFSHLSFTWEGTSGDHPYDRPHYSSTGHDDPDCPVLTGPSPERMPPVQLRTLVAHGSLADGTFAEWFAEMDGFDGEVIVDWPVPCSKCCRGGANLPADGHQLARLKRAFAARRGDTMAEAIRGAALDMWRAGTLTADLADQFIRAAEAVPVPAQAPSPAPRQDRPSLHLDEGRYAVEIDGKLRFFSVTEGKGRWAGRHFVNEVIGGQQDKSTTREVALAARKAILADVYDRPANEEWGIEAGRFTGPEGAALRYADEIGRCVLCNRHLTDPISRQTGMGPDCGGRR